MQNFVVLSLTVWTHVGGPKQFVGSWDPPPWDGGVADRLETRCSPHVSSLPNFVALGQIVYGRR